MSRTPSERARMVAEYGQKRYAHTLTADLVWLFQGGEIPGIELVPPGELRAFFESTNPDYWVALMESGPEGYAEAVSQLDQWRGADKSAVAGGVLSQ